MAFFGQIQWPNIDRQLVVPLIKHDLKGSIHDTTGVSDIFASPDEQDTLPVAHRLFKSPVFCQVPGCHAYKLYEGYKRARWGLIWQQSISHFCPSKQHNITKPYKTNIKEGDSRKIKPQDLCCISHECMDMIWFMTSSNLWKWKSDKQYTSTLGDACDLIVFFTSGKPFCSIGTCLLQPG